MFGAKKFDSDHGLPFDFVIDKVIIELDGRQHFVQVANWDSVKETQIKSYKTQTCIYIDNKYEYAEHKMMMLKADNDDLIGKKHDEIILAEHLANDKNEQKIFAQHQDYICYDKLSEVIGNDFDDNFEIDY